MRAGITLYAFIFCLVLSSCQLFRPADKNTSTKKKTRTTNTDAPGYSTSPNKTGDTGSNNTTAAVIPLTPLEKDMIEEINLLRTNPQGYIELIKEYMQRVRADETLSNAFKSDEIAAAKELISEMIRMRPLRPLTAHAGLHRAAVKHGEDVKGQGELDHLGSDGSLPWDRISTIAGLREGNENLVGGGSTVRESVIILLVDSGVSGRGHRLALLDPNWQYIACHSLGTVGGLDNSWIQVFGNGGAASPMDNGSIAGNTNNGARKSYPENRQPQSYSNTNRNNNRNNNSANNRNNRQSNNANDFSFMNAEERAMIDEINLMRDNPRAYVQHVRKYMNDFRNDGWDAATTREEISTAEELIKELQRRLPLSKLKPDRKLHNVARNHGEDIKRIGRIQHRGSDGSQPWDRIQRNTDLSDGNENLVGGGNSVRESVIMLLVDSGIPDRGHRRTLLNPAWQYVACYKAGNIGDMPESWVQVFGKK